MIVEQVHCTAGRNIPSAVESRYSRFLETEDQPYVTTATLTDGWSTLSYGWIERPSMVHIKNVGKTEVQLNGWKIAPGESLRGEPTGELWLCGPGCVEVGVFPR